MLNGGVVMARVLTVGERSFEQVGRRFVSLLIQDRERGAGDRGGNPVPI